MTPDLTDVATGSETVAPEMTQEDRNLEIKNRESVNTFDYLKPSPREIAKMQIYRDKLSVLEAELKGALENGRYKSLALTGLEEVGMWINKSITRD